jgi:hypothetical protein
LTATASGVRAAGGAVAGQLVALQEAERDDLRPVPSSTALLAALAGLTFGLSLIVAIGAQNAFVLRQGLLCQHRGIVVAVCVVSDVALIALGVGGAGALLAAAPALAEGVRLAGAAFLLAYAALAARRAWRGGAVRQAGRMAPARRRDRRRHARPRPLARARRRVTDVLVSRSFPRSIGG